MAKFEALDELFDDTLTLPIKGKTYKIPSPSAEDGLKIQRIATVAARLVKGGESIDTTLLDDEEEIDLYRLCLGPVYDQLLTEVSWSQLRHAGMTAMIWIVADVEAAQQYWATGGDPSLMAPNRAARRAAKKSGSGAGSTTRSRGSMSGTSGRQATGQRRKAETTSPGAHSSPSGS